MQERRDKKLAPIKGRVYNYLLDNNIKLVDFYQETGISASIFKMPAGRSEFSGDSIAKIMSSYPDWPIDWLILGTPTPNQPKMLPASPQTGIPLIPVDAMAGYLSGEVQFALDDITYYHLPNFRGADFLIRIKGDSMTPKYQAGDLAVCKRLAMSSIFFQWGRAYVLDTDQGALVKRVNKGSSEHKLLLVSENQSYAPFEIEIDSLYNVAQIMGIIREE